MTFPDLLSHFAGQGPDLREFCVEAGLLLPNEGLEELPVRHQPANAEQVEQLYAALTLFQMGGPATRPYPPNLEPEEEPKPKKRKAKQDKLDLDLGECCGGLCILNRRR